MTAIVSKGLTLCARSDGHPVQNNEVLTASDGSSVTVLGGTAPRHSEAVGRVYVVSRSGFKSELAPADLQCEWRAL